MSYYFEKPIVDTKEIFTRVLVNTLSPLLYEGFFSIYEKAQKIELTYIEGSKVDPSIENPGIIKLFQFLLKGVKDMNNHMLDTETTRIKGNSGCADIFDDLIQSVIKAHIIVLTYNASGKKCKIVNDEHHKKISSKIFIQKCYCECARLFYDHSMLFWHGFGNHELKENQKMIYHLIKVGIYNAIDNSLPLKEIVTEYLSNNYINDNHEQEDLIDVRDMINRDLHPEQFTKDEGGVRQILEEESSVINHNFSFKDDEELAALIFDRNIHQTIDDKSSEKKQEVISNNNLFKTSEKKQDKVSENQNKADKVSEKLQKTSEKIDKVDKISSEKKNIETYETDITKLLMGKKKGKISENILKDFTLPKVEEPVLNIDKNYNDADNYFGDFGEN